MADDLLGLHLLQVIKSSPNGELSPRESVRRLATDYHRVYFPRQPVHQVRQLLQDEGDLWNEFFQRIRRVRMSLTYRGLLGIRDPQGRHEGKWVMTVYGEGWLERVWQGPDADYSALRLPPKRDDWRFISRQVVGEAAVLRHIERIDLDQVEPRKFEELVAELLRRMGWRPVLTRQSSDGGIDIDAHNPEPVVGGRILVQCKRRRRTVGVSTVRELFGVVSANQASKGVLVTTGKFSLAASKFARDKPIDLIDRQQLDTLLQKHAIVASQWS